MCVFGDGYGSDTDITAQFCGCLNCWNSDISAKGFAEFF